LTPQEPKKHLPQKGTKGIKKNFFELVRTAMIRGFIFAAFVPFCG
jgi:hypothetical protein